MYFNKLFKDNNNRDGQLENTMPTENYNYYWRIRLIIEVKEALRKLYSKKPIGSNGSPIDIWKCLGDKEIERFTNLCNNILSTKRMPNEWKNTLVRHV